MPGTSIPGYLRKATQLARAGIFDLRIFHDEVLMPILRHWRVFELEGLSPEAETERQRLAVYLRDLDANARRFEERRDAPSRAWTCSSAAVGSDSCGDRADAREASAPSSGERRRPRLRRASSSPTRRTCTLGTVRWHAERGRVSGR